MFTGIITNLASVSSLEHQANQDLLLILRLEKQENLNRKLDIGCSIACNGICLTLVKKEQQEDHFLLHFNVSRETINKSTIKNWQIGDKINLEFALRIGDELGGHLVSGHVDDVTEIKNIQKIDDSWCFTFGLDAKLKKFISAKGSIVLNGTSLTINDVFTDSFQVNIINHTFHHTNFHCLQVGDKLNLEIDQIARYLYNLKLFQDA